MPHGGNNDGAAGPVAALLKSATVLVPAAAGAIFARNFSASGKGTAAAKGERVFAYPEGKDALNSSGGPPVIPAKGEVFRSKAPHHLKPTEIDDKDKGTPDDWIPRHPDIIRLTGRHPLNCEPPMTTLMETGFNTPPALHYVRNHGPAPRIKWEDHRITVNGLVDKPITYTMEELMKLPQQTIPVTLVCAGNRRKEQNMIKKTIGFSWGSAGLGTSYWTGVRLCDILKASGVKPGATHVSFRGPKKELPQGDDGSYGTSLELPVAMNPAEDVMVCWKQDGELLTPDHGYPVRMIIPGFIGGRMVKWLEEITVTDKESDNFYHFFDNRVLPPQIDQKTANEEGWWYKPEYIINELNINSAIGYPAHGEVLPLDGSVQEYTVRGYAYTGGGRKIIRCEVSLDDGKTWRLADIHRFQKPTEFGRFWCWDFWSLKIALPDLLRCKEICVRAFDAAQNTQPEWPTWTVMGMMNNPWFRVRVNPCVTDAGVPAVTFQHPTQPANQPGGWMGDNPVDPAAAAAPAAKAAVPKKDARRFTRAEVAKHDKEDDVWLIYHGKVYDATAYMKDHPGGADSILMNGGMDCTDEFDSIHSAKAKAMIEDYYIGELDDSATASMDSGSTADEAAAKVALKLKERVKLPLIKREDLSHNVRLLRFGLPSKDHRLGLPIGKHVMFYAKVGGETVVRAYTPITNDRTLGHVDFVIKVYFANEHPRFPAGGKMTQHLETLKVGDELEFRGPLGEFVYHGRGKYTYKGKEGFTSGMTMIAGGTGITPMWQVLEAVLADPGDKTEIRLIYANQTTDDILLWKEMDALAAKHKNFRAFYTLDRPPADWKMGKGFVSEEMVRGNALKPQKDTLALMCGPPIMLEKACVPNLEKNGYSKDQMVFF